MSLMTLAFQLSDGRLPFVDLVQVIASELEIDLGDPSFSSEKCE
ncbi:hypothetical protein [Pseudomonas syringae group genomosp. 3]|nr:hypothetical protein [Pseudomonas syringae group genomosp. 3]